MARILHVVEAFGGGVLTYLEGLTGEQCRKGHKVFIAYGVRSETPETFMESFDTRVEWFRINNFKRALGVHDIKAGIEIYRVFKKCRPDIIHFHSSKSGAIGRIMFLFNKKTRQFYTPHGYPFLMTNISGKKKTFYKVIEKIAARCSRAATIACGHSEYMEAKKLGGKNFYVNNGVNIPLLETYSEGHEVNLKQPVVGIVARIITQKNPAFFNRVAELLPHVKFVWIGDGLLSPSLSAPNITITGWKSWEKAMEMLGDIDIFLLPSLWEGLPMSMLEAMSMKKLCIVSDIDSMKEVVEPGINGYITSTPEDAANVIQKIIDGEIDYSHIVAKAYEKLVKDYSATAMADSYDGIYFGKKDNNDKK